MLAVAFKICEKVVLQQFSNDFQRNGFLSKHQGGNRKYHSTETPPPEGCPIHPHRNGPYKPCVDPYGSNGSTTGVYGL